MQRQWLVPAFVALAALVVSVNARSADICGVARQFLQRHGVPCPLVLKVDRSHDSGDVATCQDGRQWILMWLENEIAFVQQPGREPYKWDSDVFKAHPEIYSLPRKVDKNSIAVADTL